MRIHYVTGSRADFGLMKNVLEHLDSLQHFDIGCVVTGQHLLKKYGTSRNDITQSGLRIVREIAVSLSGDHGVEMGQALAHELLGFLECWQIERPDLVVVLGDRGEMLAAAIAAVHLGIHVAHIHGGEVSGTLDESFRHAISKLAHFHFTANEDAAQRLARMGEKEEFIWNVGAPGLVGITNGTQRGANWFNDRFQVDRVGPALLVCFHPVVQQAAFSADQMSTLLDFISAQKCHGIILRPNSDAGGRSIDQSIDRFVEHHSEGRRFAVVAHLERSEYLACLAHCDLMIGNSSSGIIESASFGLPCINLGDRQNGRLRNANVIDCKEISFEAIGSAYARAIEFDGPYDNLYGDGKTDERIAKIFSKLPLTLEALSKQNTY